MWLLLFIFDSIVLLSGIVSVFDVAASDVNDANAFVIFDTKSPLGSHF